MQLPFTMSQCRKVLVTSIFICHLLATCHGGPLLGYLKYHLPQGTIVNPDSDAKGSCPLVWMPVLSKYGNLKRPPPDAIKITSSSDENSISESEPLYYATYINSSNEPFIISSTFVPLCSSNVNATNLVWNRMLILSNPYNCKVGWHNSTTDVTSFAVHPVLNDEYIFTQPASTQALAHGPGCASDFYTPYTSDSLSYSSSTDGKLILYVSDTIDVQATRTWFKLVVQDIRADKVKLTSPHSPIVLNSTGYFENNSSEDSTATVSFQTSSFKLQREAIVTALTGTFNIEFTEASKRQFGQMLDSLYPPGRKVVQNIPLRAGARTRAILLGDSSTGIANIWYKMHIVPIKVTNLSCFKSGWTNKRILAALSRLGSDVEKVTEVDFVLLHEDSFVVPVQRVSNVTITVETSPIIKIGELYIRK